MRIAAFDAILNRYGIWLLDFKRELMVAMNEIEQFGRRIGEEFGAERVILFGSYARGNACADSDVDLLIIGPFTGRSADTSVAIQMKLRPPFPVDLLVRTPEKVRERIAMGDTFMQEILGRGRLCMKPMTAEWVAKAERDFATMERECSSSRRPQLRGRMLPRPAVRGEVPESAPVRSRHYVWESARSCCIA